MQSLYKHSTRFRTLSFIYVVAVNPQFQLINQSRISHPLTWLSTLNLTATRKQNRFYSHQSTLLIQVYQVAYNAEDNRSKALSIVSIESSINQLLLQFMKQQRRICKGKKGSCLTLQGHNISSRRPPYYRYPYLLPMPRGFQAGGAYPSTIFVSQPPISQYRFLHNFSSFRYLSTPSLTKSDKLTPAPNPTFGPAHLVFTAGYIAALPPPGKVVVGKGSSWGLTYGWWIWKWSMFNGTVHAFQVGRWTKGGRVS